MIKAVIFDMFETLVTLSCGTPYFSTAMAADANVDTEAFRTVWDETEYDRSTGKLTLEEAISHTLKTLGCYSENLHQSMVEKRRAFKREVFNHIHPDIVPMLKSLKELGIKIGLISNCYSEETEYIQQSILYPFFDVPLMSYEQGICKPNEEIFKHCIAELKIKPDECLYIGDGGSHELEVARKLGMHPLQAVWYLKAGTLQLCERMNEFHQIEDPMDVIKYVKVK